MSCAKKRPPEGWHLRAVVSRACPGTHVGIVIIPNSRQNASPNLDGGGGFFPHDRMGAFAYEHRDRLADPPAVPGDRYHREEMTPRAALP